MEWLQTPALVAGWGILAWSSARFLVALAAVTLTVASVWMKPETARRVRKAIKMLAVLMLALRGKSAPGNEDDAGT